MRKIISLVLILVMLLSIEVQSFASATFNDVEGHWAEKDITLLAGRGVVKGKGNNIFDPNGIITISEFITMSVRLLGYEFDISKYDYWATPYIEEAKELQIISQNEFQNYQRAITREEMASIAANTFSKNNMVTGSNIKEELIHEMKDYSIIDDYYTDNVLISYQYGLIVGKPGALFDPKGLATRAEATVVMLRIIDETKRTEFNFDIPFTYGYYKAWDETYGWIEDSVKVFAPRTNMGERTTIPLDLYEYLEAKEVEDEESDELYFHTFYHPYSETFTTYFTPYTYSKWFDLGENDKAFYTDIVMHINMPLFGKVENKAYDLGIYKIADHAKSDKYYEYLEATYGEFLDYYFNILFEDDADEVKVIFKQILNKADGTTFIEEEHIFNGRNVYINAKNGLSMRISEIIE